MEYEPAWRYQPDKCNCDGEFIEWFKVIYKHYHNLNICHMGTGFDHKVGTELQDHNVLGITYSPEEMARYIDIIQPPYARYFQYKYKVLFTDVHAINYKLLPDFDIVTLFHLGEIYEPGIDSMTMVDVIDVFKNKLTPDGRILAYAKSAAAHLSIPLFDNALELVEVYKDLRIYRAK